MTRSMERSYEWRVTDRETLSPRMILSVHRSEILAVDMRVNLRRRDVGVAEHFLNGTKVGATLEQVCGERVSQCMRRDVLRNLRPLDVVAQDLPGAHARERASARVQNENSLPFAALEPGT